MWRALILVGVMWGGAAHAKPERVAAAFATHEGEVQRAFRDAGAVWPPSGLFLRAYKHEGRLELWAKKKQGAERVLVRTFPVCAKSGVLGPKAMSGDLQVPEGVYRIDRFNSRSRYHLSLGLDYPNAVDRVRAAGRPPGGDIFIHGDCVTVGCLPIEDGPIAWLYVAATLGRGAGIDVHVFPCRFGTGVCEEALSRFGSELHTFWDTLRPIHAAFDTERVVPKVTIDRRGYRLGRR